jgi:hypothetical protein
MTKFLGITAVIAVIGFMTLPLTGCSEADDGGNSGGTPPVVIPVIVDENDENKSTPAVGDYDISGNMSQTAGKVTAVTVTAKEDKSAGTVYVFYEGTGETEYARSATVPQKAGSYSVTFDVAGTDEWNAKTKLSAGTLTVTEPPEYGINLDKTGTHTFDAAIAGYEAQTALTVTVTNIGLNATGALTAALSGANSGSFTLSETSIEDIEVDGTSSFTVGPNTGLTAGTYNATVTVSGGSEGNTFSKTFNVSFTVNAAPVYKITLSETAYTFTAVTQGYATAPTAATVTVTNGGNQATGNLTVGLSGTDAANFTLSKNSINSIAVNGTDTFTVQPKTGLAVKTHTATVTVSGGNGITASFTVSFTVNSPAPTYGITLSQTSTHTFTAVTVGYATAPTALSVNVTNTGNQATGALTAALSGTNSGSFALSTTSIATIAAGATSTGAFTVRPNTGLSQGTYTATVTVSGSNGITANFNVSFTVNGAAATYGITLSETETYTFTSAATGYTPSARSVTVTNTGNQATGALTAALSGTNSGNFSLTGASIASIAVGGNGSFSVTPNSGLGVGTYTATVTVTGGNSITANFNVSFTVTVAPTYGITLSQTGTYSFTTAAPGYSTPTALSVNVTNTGNQATGALTAGLSGTNSGSFTLSTTSIATIAAAGTSTGAFTVRPNTGLSAGSYNATVTVSGGANITSQTFNVSFTVDDPASPYIITGSGTSFTAAKSGATIGTANQPIQTVINAIRTHANGSARTIQFGNNVAVLNIGSASASFNNTGGTWGAVTLTGMITSEVAETTTGTIAIAGNVAVTISSTGDISNSAEDINARAVYHDGTGTLTIDGTVSAAWGRAVHNNSTGNINITGGNVQTIGQYTVFNNSTGTVTISGGTVYSEDLYAVYNLSTGTINISGGMVLAENNTISSSNGPLNISGGSVTSYTLRAINGGTGTGKITVSGTANISASEESASDGAIFINAANGATAVTRLEITGGTVKNSAAGGKAIFNAAAGVHNITISGGTVQGGTGGYAVYVSNANAMLTLSGNPTITGIIRLSAAGRLEAASGFTPGTKNYVLEYASYAAGAVAVKGGSSHLARFSLNSTAWLLAASGSDLVLVADDPTAPYIITGSGTSFTAKRNDVTIGTANQPIQTVIDAIRTHAGGGDRTIQFGNLTTTLDIGANSVNFNNSGGTWGVVTLTGKITSSMSSNTSGTIVTANAVAVTSTADIGNSVSGYANAVYHNSTGAFTISGGTVSAYTGGAVAVYNNSTGTVTISGGTVQATSTGGHAVHNASTGKITISQPAGTTTKVTSSNNSTNNGTIYLADSGTATAVRLEITGGTVENTNNSGNYSTANTIYNASTGGVTISGGTVSAVKGVAVYNNSTGKITVSGTTTKVTSANDTSGYNRTIYLANSGTATTARLEITGGTVENTSSGDAVYNDSTGGVTISGGTVSSLLYSIGAVTISGGTVSRESNWGSGTVTISGGTVSGVYNGSTGTINISGGTVSGTTGRAVENNSTGAVNISGGTVSATTGYAVYNNSTGKITISQPAGATTKVTSANVTAAQGTIYIASSGSATADRLAITGGTVENTASNVDARAIYNAGSGGVTISGGTVSSAATGRTVHNNGSGTINISGGTVSATGGTFSATTGVAVYNNGSSGTVNISGGTVSATTGITVINISSGTINISGGTVQATTGVAVKSEMAGKVTISGSATKITSANPSTSEGTIFLSNSSVTSVRLEITDGTVSNTTSAGYAVRNATGDNATGYAQTKKTGGTVGKTIGCSW